MVSSTMPRRPFKYLPKAEDFFIHMCVLHYWFSHSLATLYSSCPQHLPRMMYVQVPRRSLVHVCAVLCHEQRLAR